MGDSTGLAEPNKPYPEFPRCSTSCPGSTGTPPGTEIPARAVPSSRLFDLIDRQLRENDVDGVDVRRGVPFIKQADRTVR